MAKDDFFTITIQGMKFAGCMSGDGPYILATVAPGFKGVALGYCCDLTHCPADLNGAEGWYICKYHHQKRVHLANFTEDDVQALSDAFFINISHRSIGHQAKRLPFIGSPAWKGLVEWVRKHPRIAKNQSRFCEYIPNWYELAVSEAKANSP